MSAEQELRRAVLAASFVMFAEGFCATMTFPFASFMVQRLRGTDESLGIMTGLFFTAFPFGSLLTARMWGSAANRLGRRACLLVSLSFSTWLTFAIAICPVYEFIVMLQFLRGSLNCSLAMTRTCLRERVDELQGDEVWAFSVLQASFAASSVVGPAVGGFLYGWPVNHDSILPWASPHIAAFGLYILAFTFSYAFVVETVNLEVTSKEVSLFGHVSIIHLLIMVAGHSYVFTGFQVGYPLFARNSLEAWTSTRIGVAFLIGSVGLLFHTIFTYPAMVKRMGLSTFWSWSWIVCIIVLITFPRILNLLLTLGFDGKSSIIAVANWVPQLCISMFQGCNFTTLQLMMNRLISARDDAEHALPLANAWMVSMQALARAISPVMTGSLLAYPTVCQGVLAFDALAGIAALCCLLRGWALQKSLVFPLSPVVGPTRSPSLPSMIKATTTSPILDHVSSPISGPLSTPLLVPSRSRSFSSCSTFSRSFSRSSFTSLLFLPPGMEGDVADADSYGELNGSEALP